MPNKPNIANVHVSYPRGSRYFILPDHTVSQFYGMNTLLSDPYKFPDGVTPDSLNWITGDEQDCIILRRGYHLLGQSRTTGSGKIMGLGMGNKADGTQVPFFATSTGKIKYYNATTNDTVEVGSSIVPLAARLDTISIAPYQNLAGYFCYLSSPNWDIVKIPVANPGSYVPQLSPNYKGYMGFGQSRALLFNRNDGQGGLDKTGLYMSNVDAIGLTDDGTQYAYTGDTVKGTNTIKNLSSNLHLAAGMAVVGTGIPASATIVSVDSSSQVTISTTATATASTTTFTFGTLLFPFVQTTAESVGSSGSTAYSHTLTNVTGVKTCFRVTIQASVAAGTETFTDDQNGKLTSNFGGTGTVNYATGATSVTFSDVTTGSVTANYYTEDATAGGVVNFANTTGTDGSGNAIAHIAGSGRYFPQFDGGNLNAVFPLANVFYGFHEYKTWQTTVPTDDSDTGNTSSSNLPFREKMGVSTPDSAFGTAIGTFYINNANPSRPEIYQLKLFTGTTSANVAAPTLVSDALNLSSFSFDYACVFQWGIYILVACAQIRNGTADAFNSRTFVYNTRSGSWDLLDYPTAKFSDYMGTLLSGDPLTDNVFQLFSGFDDDGGITPNFWTSGWTNHGTPGQKTHHRMVVNGLIQASQNIAVDLAYDGGDFTEVFRILGNGSYVDSGKSIDVGSYTLGSKLVGGGATVFANPFEVEFNISSDRFEFVRVRFRACVPQNDTDPTLPQAGGYAQINFYQYKAIRYKGQRSPNVRMAS